MDAVTVVTEGFDYTQLDAETRIVVQQRTGEIKTLVRKSAQDVIEIGAKLHEVKERLGHGQFGQWLTGEFEWSDRAAQQFMAVAQRFKSANFADLTVAPSALYLLAAPSTPDEAVAEALDRAAAGETISHATAKGIVQEHKTAPQYISVSELQRRVDEHARANGWTAPVLRNNYRQLEAALTVAYRHADLVKAVHNVADQWEDREEQQRKANYAAWSGITAHKWEGYADWTNDDDAEYAALLPIWEQPAGAFNSIDESSRITRWRVAARLASERRDNLAFSLQETARLLRLKDIGAKDALRADIASREAVAAEAERQVAADVDTWIAAFKTTGTRQNRTHALARAITPWVEAYRDEWGRIWREIDNPSHSSGTFWREFSSEAARRGAGLLLNVNADVAKEAIKIACLWLASESDTVGQASEAVRLDDMPVIATTATDTRQRYQVAVTNLRTALQALDSAADAIRGLDDDVLKSIDSVASRLGQVTVILERGKPAA